LRRIDVAQDSVYARGVASLAMAAVFIGGTNVVFGSVVQDIPPVMLTFVAFTISTVIFGVVNRGRCPALDRVALRNIIGLNFASAGVFLFLYTGLKYLEPAIASALQAGATPLFTVVVLGLLQRHWELRPAELAGAATILTGSVALAWVSFSGRSALSTQGHLGTVLGIAAVLASGLSTVFLTLCAKRLTQLGWSNLNILGHRCYVTVLGCGLLSLGVRPEDWQALAGSSAVLALFAVLGITIPLLLLQVGIRHVAPFVVLAMTNLNPILTYLLQLFDRRLSTSPYTLVGILVVLGGVLWVIYSQAWLTRQRATVVETSET
jgi:drug/metabolite transporter (DMT)-like permease